MFERAYEEKAAVGMEQSTYEFIRGKYFRQGKNIPVVYTGLR